MTSALDAFGDVISTGGSHGGGLAARVEGAGPWS